MQDMRAENLAEEQRELYELALAARKHAYAPYSHFAVGAAVRCADGKCYGGCNVENASYGLCCCGERTPFLRRSVQASGSWKLYAWRRIRLRPWLPAALAVR